MNLQGTGQLTIHSCCLTTYVVQGKYIISDIKLALLLPALKEIGLQS
jgi:hypothetical protein